MDQMNKDELLLIQLILMFQTAALQHMGKIKNPITDKVEQDLQQAQISIDILELLQRKMKNNLSANEEKMFSTVLQDLRLNYVDEIGKMQKGTTQSNEQSTPTVSS
jgi:hypothetical protein